MRITETDGVYVSADVSTGVFYHLGARKEPQTLDPRVTIFLSTTLLHCAKTQSCSRN